MGYTISIERHDAAGKRCPIPRAHWEAAIGKVDGVRLIDRKVDLGSGIEIDNPGAAEVLDSTSGAWRPALHWSERGYATFDAADSFDDPTSEFGWIVHALAARLGAKLVGDEGEIYG